MIRTAQRIIINGMAALIMGGLLALIWMIPVAVVFLLVGLNLDGDRFMLVFYALWIVSTCQLFNKTEQLL